MTFADRAMGLAAWVAAGQQPCTTVQFSMGFAAAAQIGSFIEIAPRVIRTTHSLIFMDGLLMTSGTELATAQGVWKVLWREGPVAEST